MGQNSKIEWTTHTFNPWRGCVKVSEACRHCYAETTAKRNVKVLGMWGSEASGGTRVVASESMWREPLKWNLAAEAVQQEWAKRANHEQRRIVAGFADELPPRPERPRVFCASFADVFEDWTGPMVVSNGNRLMLDSTAKHWQVRDAVHGDTARYSKNRGCSWNCPKRFQGFRRCDLGAGGFVTMDHVRRRLFELIDATPNLDWLLLTKRPENILSMVWDWCRDELPQNVWIGTTVENQETADKRIPELLSVPAKVRFLSCEPLLGEVDLTRIPVPKFPGVKFDSLLKYGKGAWGTGARIDWVIVGGESGPGSRPMHPTWAKSLRNQCLAAGVPYFFKQWGDWVSGGKSSGLTIDQVYGYEPHRFDDGIIMNRVGKKPAGRLLDGREWNEVPSSGTVLARCSM